MRIPSMALGDSGSSRGSARLALTSSVALLGLGLAACGGPATEPPADDPGSTPTVDNGDQGGEQPGNDLKVAQGASLWPGGINDFIAPILFAEDFDVKLDPNNLETFSSSTTSTQVLVSGGLDAASTSFVGGVQAIASGQPLKFFCVGTTGYTALILGTGDIQSLDDIDPETTKVSIEPPGGPSNLFMDLVFTSRGLDFRTSDFEQTVVLDDSPLRLAALIRGDAQVAIVDVEMLPEIQDALGEDEVHILSNVMDDVGGEALFTAWLTTTDWLEQNEDLAARFCASMLKGNRALTEDFELFTEVNMKYLDYDVTEDELKFTWEDIGKYGIFPATSDGLSQARVSAVIEASIESGVLDESVRDTPLEDLVAIDVLKKADALVEADDTGTDDPVY